MVFYPFYVLLDFTCHYLYRKLFRFHKRYWHVIFFSCNVFVWFWYQFLLFRRFLEFICWCNLYYTDIIRELVKICLVCRYNSYWLDISIIIIPNSLKVLVHTVQLFFSFLLNSSHSTLLATVFWCHSCSPLCYTFLYFFSDALFLCSKLF